ncbi:hypothetical protein LINBF2_02440 [Limnohabitans sp. INBF002]|nr:hypothetical protein LINBF2_02440 [Limnohabitans sp. INBF002]
MPTIWSGAIDSVLFVMPRSPVKMMNPAAITGIAAIHPGNIPLSTVMSEAKIAKIDVADNVRNRGEFCVHEGMVFLEAIK